MLIKHLHARRVRYGDQGFGRAYCQHGSARRQHARSQRASRLVMPARDDLYRALKTKLFRQPPGHFADDRAAWHRLCELLARQAAVRQQVV